MAEIFLAQRDRWVLWLPLAPALGIAAYFSLLFEPPLYAGGLLLLFLAICGAPFYGNRVFLRLWLCLLLVVVGFTAAQLRTWQVAAPVLAEKTYPVTVEGRVVVLDTLPNARRIVVDNITLRTGKIWRGKMPERVRIRLKGNDATPIAAGDIVAVKAILLPLSPPVLPGAFDFQRHAYFMQLGATGYAIGDTQMVAAHNEGFFFEKLRKYIRRNVEKDIAKKENAALITAFMVGEDDAIPEKVWDICRLSGIAHLVAISGSHFMLIAGFTFFVIRAFLAAFPHMALRWPIKKIAAGGAMAMAIFYMLLIGAPIPAQRAVFSVCVVMMAIMLDRDPFTLRLVAFSAFFILLIEPESLMGASFQMSFAAVAGLVAFYEGTRNWWNRQLMEAPWPKRYALYLIGCFLSTLVASLSTAPYSLFNFSRLSLIGGLVANLIAVPVSSFITFPAGLLACVLMPLGLEKWPLRVTELSLDLIMDVAATVASWPHAMYQADMWPQYLLGLITLGGLWLCIWQGRMRFLGLLPIAVAALIIPLTPRPDVLIAGKGDLFAVRAPEDGRLWLSSRRAERFVAGEWAELEGSRGVAYWPGDMFEKDFLSCDPLGCTYTAKDRRVLFVLMPELVKDGCGADLVVSAEKIDSKKCRADADVLDASDLRRNGTHALYLTENGVRIDSVTAQRGQRPWTGSAEDVTPFAAWEDVVGAEGTDDDTEAESYQ